MPLPKKLDKTIFTFGTEFVSPFRPMGALDTNEAGQPVQRYVKDLIKVGLYVHPFAGWELDVTPERMDRWVAAFGQMKEAGIDVEAVKDHSFNADDVVGYVVDMFRDVDEDGKPTLFGVHELVGEESIALAGRVKNVSIWLEQNYVDGTGREFGEAIIHSSIVQQPVAPDQKGFVPVKAASGRQAKAASLRQATGEPEMKIEDWRKLLGAGEDLTDENLLERVGDRLSKLGGEKDDAVGKVTKLEQDIEAMKGKVADLEAKAAGRGEPQVDPDAIEMLAEGTADKLDGLAAKGHITPAVAASLKVALVGKPGAYNARALSRSANGGTDPLAKLVIAALADNTPAKLGEHTKGQCVALSRTVPGGAPTETDADVVKTMVGAAS